jgi:hypothetical protein
MFQQPRQPEVEGLQTERLSGSRHKHQQHCPIHKRTQQIRKAPQPPSRMTNRLADHGVEQARGPGGQKAQKVCQHPTCQQQAQRFNDRRHAGQYALACRSCGQIHRVQKIAHGTSYMSGHAVG